MEMRKIGVDLLWVRPTKDGSIANGGTYSYIKNILDGLSTVDVGNKVFYLYVSRDNQRFFEEYHGNNKFVIKVCNTNSISQWRRIMWENLHINRLTEEDNLDVWFVPVFSRPIMLSKKTLNVTVIHDLISMHYLENYSKMRALYFWVSWRLDVRFSNKIITISDFCKRDIIQRLGAKINKIEVIYNPIIIKESETKFSTLQKKYGIEKQKYLYTVSSLAKHKNLITIIKMLRLLKDTNESVKLVITGVIDNDHDILSFVENNGLKDNVIYTGRISDSIRDCLYDNCKVFLFPSVFEGFGMPAIEAMQRNIPVITTKETALYEVTQGEAFYVDNPYDENEWFQKLLEVFSNDNLKSDDKLYRNFDETLYDIKNVTNRYLKLLEEVMNDS